MDFSVFAHSVSEIFFYLMATPCAVCGKGPLESDDIQTHAGEGRLTARTVAGCRNCGATEAFTFELPPDASPADRDELYPTINATDEPSRILDVGQWLVLFRVILEAAEKSTDKIEARRLGYEAALCLEEALKFYHDAEDLPPAEALFTDASRARLRQRPDTFSRAHLIEMRRKLPSTSSMRRRLDTDKPRRRWWNPFGRGGA